MALATPDDVAARLGRELSAEELRLCAALLDDAERMLISRVPELLARVADGRLARVDVELVESTMVLRVVRNPSGYRSETAGDYGYTVDIRAAAGFLTVLPQEWRLVGVRGGAFTIAPFLGGGRPR